MLLRAMGTEVRIEGRGAEDAAGEILRLEAMLTRFAPSPLTRLNEEGCLRDPPPDLVAALRHALAVADLTGGLVTPTVLDALEHAGYRRSWPAVDPPLPGPPPMVPATAGIEVNEGRIGLPAGVRLDLGGTAKSWIAERAARLMPGEAVLDAGGDVLIRRRRPSPVEVVDPLGGEPLTLVIPPGRWGVATSSVMRRAWAGAHHLIDPRTGLPSRAPWLQATAVAKTVTWAEVTSKLLLLGEQPPGVAMTVAFDADGRAWSGTGPEGSRRDADGAARLA